MHSFSDMDCCYVVTLRFRRMMREKYTQTPISLKWMIRKWTNLKEYEQQDLLQVRRKRIVYAKFWSYGFTSKHLPRFWVFVAAKCRVWVRLSIFPRFFILKRLLVLIRFIGSLYLKNLPKKPQPAQPQKGGNSSIFGFTIRNTESNSLSRLNLAC